MAAPAATSATASSLRRSLSGSADAILVENWFFIDSTVSISQNEITPFASGGNDSFNRTGNTNTTYDYSVSPYIARRFKDTAELNLRYTWDDQFNTADAVEDSSSESAQALLGSVPGVSKYSWGLQGDYSKVSYDDSFVGDENFGQENVDDSELSSAQLNQGFQLDRFWQVNGFYGQEWNDFVSSRDDIDGTFWDVGLRWTPNTRTTVDAGYGDRFFGANPRFAATYRHKRSAFSASYAKDHHLQPGYPHAGGFAAPQPGFSAASGSEPGCDDPQRKSSPG